MGGGDLNSKKSWHPNTMKNQERVWKAEQAAAEEKKRIMELQSERAAERDHAELNSLAKRSAGGSSADDNRLHWMYDKPDKKAHEEDYLLGRAIEKNYDQPEKSDDIIPAVARRVVGSSMLTTAGDTQVDLARKIREDPLLLVKERERAARAALLNNPLHRKRLTELLRKEQEHKKESKSKKKLKKKVNDLDNQLAAKLNALGGEKGLNLASLLASDDSSSDSSDEEQKKKKLKKQKKKKSKKSKKTDSASEDEKRRKLKTKEKSIKEVKNKSNKSNKSKYIDSEDDNEHSYKPRTSDKQVRTDSRKRRSDNFDSDEEVSSKRRKSPEGYEQRVKHTRSPISNRRKSQERNKKWSPGLGRKESPESYRGPEKSRRSPRQERRSPEYRRSSPEKRSSEKKRSPEYNRRRNPERSLERKRRSPEQRKSPERDRRRQEADSPEGGTPEMKRGKPRQGLSAEERAARLAAMAAAGAERERSRGRRVAEQRARAAAEDAAPPPPARAAPHARALPDSLESRLHSNRHYIQRDKTHMDRHFARR